MDSSIPSKPAYGVYTTSQLVIEWVNTLATEVITHKRGGCANRNHDKCAIN